MSNPIDRQGLRNRFWESVPLAKMTAKEWEALCDGCGKCCLNKLEDDETGHVELTCISCRYMQNHCFILGVLSTFKHLGSHK